MKLQTPLTYDWVSIVSVVGTDKLDTFGPLCVTKRAPTFSYRFYESLTHTVTAKSTDVIPW